MNIYLDNSATTKCSRTVAELMSKILTEDFGNPSSMHQKGVEAESYMKEAKQYLSQLLKVNEKELFFTSGGTESNNLAIIGTAYANQRKGKHLISTKIEHPSVKNPILFLEEQGFEVTWLSVNKEGVIDLTELENAIREDTILVSVMHVNNEIGSVQPIEAIAKVIHQKNTATYFHVDSVQGFGKYRITPKKMGIDLMSVSGHKFHGPKGMGILYVNEKVKLQPILFGGGQQQNIRSGTENVPGIAGIALAAKECYTNFEEKIDALYEKRQYLIKQLQEIEDVTLNGPLDRSGAPHIISASFFGVRSEVLLHTLEEKGIYVSAGSACATHKKSVSDTLNAIGLDKKRMEGTLRFSLSEDVTMEQLQYCVEEIKKVLPILKKYRSR